MTHELTRVPNAGPKPHLSIVDKIEFGDCWEWQGSSSAGYGNVHRNGRNQQIHRFMWEVLVGEIPEGLTLDHLCKNTRCCNPDHLEPVTLQENILRGYGWSGRNRRKTHCPREHRYTEENIYRTSTGGRACRQCESDRVRVFGEGEFNE